MMMVMMMTIPEVANIKKKVDISDDVMYLYCTTTEKK